VDRADEPQRRAAEAARYRLNVPHGAPVDVFDAITREGIRLLRFPLGDNGLLGAYKRLFAEEFIVINSSVTPVRQRFTAAHELGHHFLGDGGEAAHFDTDRSLWAVTDRPATWFAGHLLMDEQGLRELVVAETPVRAALIAADRFEVSIEAAAIQLETIRLFPPGTADVVRTERRRYDLLADLYKDQGLHAPPSRVPDKSVTADPKLVEEARALVAARVIDREEAERVLKMLPKEPARSH
jgi:Zn-dependent peptidase ImmA (M78 family)